MPRSNLVNAVDTALAAPVGGADPTITVTDATELPDAPFYLVIDPFDDNEREYCYCTAVNGDVLSVNRNLDGTESTTHLAGDVVRISYVAQLLDDIWAEMDLYLPLAGGTMTGDINMDGWSILDAVNFVGKDGSYMQFIPPTDTGILFKWFNQTQNAIGIFPNDDGTLEFYDPAGSTLFSYRHNSPTEIVFNRTLTMGSNDIVFYANRQIYFSSAGRINLETGTIINLVDPTDDQDAATKAYVDGQVGLYLPLTGGQMSGPITSAGDIDLNPANELVVNIGGVDRFRVADTAAVSHVPIAIYTEEQAPTGLAIFNTFSVSPTNKILFANSPSDLSRRWQITWSGASGYLSFVYGPEGGTEPFMHFNGPSSRIEVNAYLRLARAGNGTGYLSHQNILWMWNETANYGRIGQGNGSSLWAPYTDGGSNISQIGFAPQGGEVWDGSLIGAIEAGWGGSSPYILMGLKRDNLNTYVSFLYDSSIHSSSGIIADSDASLKDDIVSSPVSAPAVPLTSKTWKQKVPSEEYTGTLPTRRGYTAQDIEAAFPGVEGLVIEHGNDNRKGIDYQALVSVAFDIISDLTDRIEALEEA